MVNDNIAGAFLCNDMDLQVVEETIEKGLSGNKHMRCPQKVRFFTRRLRSSRFSFMQ